MEDLVVRKGRIEREAPAMLEFIREIADTFEDPDDRGLYSMGQEARAILRRIEG